MVSTHKTQQLAAERGSGQWATVLWFCCLVLSATVLFGTVRATPDRADPLGPPSVAESLGTALADSSSRDVRATCIGP